MKERLEKYLTYIDAKINELRDTTADLSWVEANEVSVSIENEKKDLLIQIAFFQHERFIHLLVTVLFALMSIMTFMVVMLAFTIQSLLLLLLLVVLLIPYIRHYYILENGTQKLYKFYDSLQSIAITKQKVVAFTFDDGPVEYSKESSAMSILHTLNQYGQHATFFYLGRNINEQSKQEIEFAKSIGCEIGNHGYSHCRLTDLKEEDIREELKKTDRLLSDIINKFVILTRLPYLAYNEQVLQAIDRPLISCSIDTRDWDQASTEEIIEAVLSAEAKGDLNGAIILMHETYYTTASAVQYLVPTLIKKGYQIVSVSEMASIKNITLKAHHVYVRL